MCMQVLQVKPVSTCTSLCHDLPAGAQSVTSPVPSPITTCSRERNECQALLLNMNLSHVWHLLFKALSVIVKYEALPTARKHKENSPKAGRDHLSETEDAFSGQCAQLSSTATSACAESTSWPLNSPGQGWPAHQPTVGALAWTSEWGRSITLSK